MFQRLAQAALGASLLFLSVGCIQEKDTFTLNPDGKGKVNLDVISPADTAGPGSPDERTLEQKKIEDLVKKLMAHKDKIVAWKDVSEEWLPDGRLHFVGTAYFENIEKLGGDNSENFSLKREKDAMILTLLPRKKVAPAAPPPNPGKPALPDLSKMTDKDLDEFILNERAKYQSNKGIATAFLTDYKINLVFNLPGEVSETKAFKKDGNKASREVNGNDLLKKYNSFYAEDNAALKKRIKTANSLDFEKLFADSTEVLQDGAHVTVNKVGEPLFDFEKEVKEAKAAYPALRKKLNLPDDVKLPGE